MSLRLLVDILHPGHVHHYRPLAQQIVAEGGDVLFTARHKDVTVDLLEAADIPYRILSKQGHGPLGLGSELLLRIAKMLPLMRSFRPHVLAGIMGPVIAPVGRLMGIPTLVSYDTEAATVTNRWVFPLAKRVLVPSTWTGPLRPNMVTYAGLQELAYLHPNRFEADPEIVQRAGIDPEEPYIVVRLAAHVASHDRTAKGVSNAQMLVDRLEPYGRIVFSGEAGVPEALKDRVHTVAATDFHHVLAHAALVLGDGATTCVEAGVLGTPAILVHSFELGYAEAMEHRWELIARRPDPQDALNLAETWLALDPKERQTSWARKRERLLSELTDTTAVLHQHVHELGSRA